MENVIELLETQINNFTIVRQTTRSDDKRRSCVKLIAEYKKAIVALKDVDTSDKVALNIASVSKCTHDFEPSRAWRHECVKCGKVTYEKSYGC